MPYRVPNSGVTAIEIPDSLFISPLTSRGRLHGDRRCPHTPVATVGKAVGLEPDTHVVAGVGLQALQQKIPAASHRVYLEVQEVSVQDGR